MGQERKQLCSIEQRQFKLLGYLTHKQGLEDLALCGRFPGNSAGGTQRFTFIKNFKLLYKNLEKLWEAARSRTNWGNITVHRGMDQP